MDMGKSLGAIYTRVEYNRALGEIILRDLALMRSISGHVDADELLAISLQDVRELYSQNLAKCSCEEGLTPDIDEDNLAADLGLEQ